MSTSGPAPGAAPPPTGANLRTLFTLAWPLVVSRATQVVVGLFDVLMVSGLGETAVAASSTGALNSFALVILPMGTVFIVSSFASQLTGKGDQAGARRFAAYGLAVAVATQLLTLAALPAVEPLLGLFPYTPQVRTLLGQYLHLRLLSAGAIVGMEALSNYYGGVGNTRLPMRASLVLMVVDIFLNYLLIRGNLGAPALGVAGAALGSSIATWLAFGFLLLRFLRDGRSQPPLYRSLRWRELRRLLRFGIPAGLNWFTEFSAFLVFVNVVLAGLGTTSLAAMMAVMELQNLSFMPAFGLSSAGAILVGQAIGRGAPDEVPRIVRLTFLAAGTWQGLVGLLYVLAPEPIFGLFATGAKDPEALRAVGVRFLTLSAAWQLFDAAATTLAEALRAAGDTAFTMWARVVVAWLIFTPGSYVTVRLLGWGNDWAMFWLVLYLALLAVTLLLRFRGGAWRRIQLTEPALGV